MLALRQESASDLSREGRPYRVVSLIVAIVLMSLADLYITLVYVQSVGMGESNPLARWVMLNNSPAFLVVWKLMTVALASLILFLTRRTPVGEVASWVCCCILVWLTIRWGIYSDEAHLLTPVLHDLAQIESSVWVQVPPK